ncbi:MAG: AraC family transcriptional regulator, partial [Akkermansiaceae bacterium]|nr:AraC family transcriptional regulator [Akkermansiaceae bacterium]
MLGSSHYLRHRSEMAADPLSEILRLADARSVVSGGFTAGGAWAIRFPEMLKMKFCALVKGGCLLAIDGQKKPIRAEEGDVFLLCAQRAFTLASDLSVPAVEAAAVFTNDQEPFSQVGEGEDCSVIGGFVYLDPASGELLAGVLPPLIHVRAAAPQATVLRWLLDQFVREGEGALPGSTLVSVQLAQLMFVQILRLHLAGSGALPSGWLRALADPRLAPVMGLIHSDPARAWHLEELAKAASMSRTAFAVHFKAVAGIPPLAYLTEWRMH